VRSCSENTRVETCELADPPQRCRPSGSTPDLLPSHVKLLPHQLLTQAPKSIRNLRIRSVFRRRRKLAISQIATRHISKKSISAQVFFQRRSSKRKADHMNRHRLNDLPFIFGSKAATIAVAAPWSPDFHTLPVAFISACPCSSRFLARPVQIAVLYQPVPFSSIIDGVLTTRMHTK
jgi:hypothetical protein